MDGLLNDVSRVGATVRRRALVAMDRTFGEGVLVHLGEAGEGFDAAPRFLGHDDEGRQVLSFVEGSVREASDDDLVVVLGRVRRFHDLVPGVCHNDLAPRNTVWRADGVPVFIDWDLCAPGRPVEDVAHASWQFLALGPSRDAAEVARLLRRGVDAYGLAAADRSVLVDEIAGWMQRTADGIEQRAARGERPFLTLVARGAVTDVRASRAWVLDERATLSRALERP